MKLSEFIEKYGNCEVSDELMEMLNPKGDWIPKKGEDYCLITTVLGICHDNYSNTEYDNKRLSKRNVYRTEEEAQFALDMYHFCKERSFEPDWENGDQDKFGLYLNHARRQKGYWKYLDVNTFLPFYYPSKEVVQEIIDKYSFEELEKYYGRV